MLLAEIVETWSSVKATRSRLTKIDLLATRLRELEDDQVEIGVAFLSGEPRQDRIGVGYATVREVSSPAATPPPTLTLRDVDDALSELAGLGGPGSQSERRRLLFELLGRATEEEQAFLRGLLLRELRQGALEGIMVEALAKASDVDPQEVRRALMVGGDLRAVARAALTDAGTALGAFKLTVFRPLQPMVAQTAEDVASAMTRTMPAAVEFKLDGARVQVHRDGDEVRAYTRNLRDITGSVPELVEALGAATARSIVLDGEAIALREDGRPHPFQVTMGRFGRVLDVAEGQKELPLTPFFFDCLHADGKDLIDEPYRDRFDALTSRVPPELIVPRTIARDAESATAFYDEALARGHEGVVVKSLEAPYEAGRRGASWIKVKPAHTLDLVVLAAEWGSGRRRGWLSNLHLGARDPDRDEFVMLGKTFKGLTDEMLEWQTGRLLELERSRQGHVVYVAPELVVEVAFDGLQESTRYPAGLALRFARVKAYRPDRNAGDADTIDTVRTIHAGRMGPNRGG